MRRLRLFALALLLLGPAPPSAGEIVRAQDHDAYWLWAGVKTRPELEKAKTLYLLQGEIGPDRFGEVRLKAQGGTEPGPHAPTLWLVYRVRSLDWTPEIFAAVNRRLARWRDATRVAGVQVDFDASTHGLKNYAAFLGKLRAALPKDCWLGVTGLMDWASQATIEDIEALSETVDELIFQTYRGRETVADIDAYLARLGRLNVPFRLGIAEGAAWSPPTALARNPHFLGYVVFLRNEAEDH
ncbi:DUF3142 domain-containing protein [Methylocystis bryophila]|uniref:DUF3142 domain-containing protein n=1 Tax=Methylocystis bryophila TaxID=655015 RepID=UPI001FD9F70B|nr:DUF3142 domain-containing protein [Methylocystis bryophila]